MSCTVEEDLTAYVDGELSVVEAARVRSHLAACSGCRQTEALLRRTMAEVAMLPAYEPSPALRRRVLAEIEALPRPWSERMRRWLSPGALAPAGVALAAAAVVAVVVGQRTAAERQLFVGIGTALEQCLNYGGITARRCQPQRCGAIMVGQARLSAGL